MTASSLGPTLVTAIAAVAGTLPGGLGSFATTYVTVRRQGHADRALKDLERREELCLRSAAMSSRWTSATIGGCDPARFWCGWTTASTARASTRRGLDAAFAALANSTQTHAARMASLQGQVANLANAEAQLVRARADMQRDDDLVRDGSVSVRERDQNLAAFRAAEAQVLQARAAAEIARQDIRTVDVGQGGLQANVEPGPSCGWPRSISATR